MYNDYFNYQISYTSSEIMISTYELNKDIMLDFFEVDDNTFRAKLENILLIECSKLQDLVTPFDSFDSLESFTSSYDPAPEVNIIDLTSDETKKDTDAANSSSPVAKRTITSPIINPYKTKRPRTTLYQQETHDSLNNINNNNANECTDDATDDTIDGSTEDTTNDPTTDDP